MGNAMSRVSRGQLVSSPACLPQMPLEEILPAFADLGFRKFEAFCVWCKSALDVKRAPGEYVQMARDYDMSFSSMHLPPITADFDASLAKAVETARFAAAIGAKVVLYKADSREDYIKGAGPFLAALEREKIAVVPVLQNHKGTPISTLEDFRAVIRGIADPRMKTLLEVGHFQRVGVSWQQGWELLGDSVALVHINEIDAANNSVPFGTGLVDFAGLFGHLGKVGYRGDIVVELELVDRTGDPATTLGHLKNAMKMLGGYCE